MKILSNHLMLKIILTVVAVLHLSGCPSTAVIVDVREIQTAFSEAAKLDNRLSTTPEKDITPTLAKVLDDAQTRYGYVVSRSTAIENDDEQKKQLLADNLLGNLLTLKALSQWRMGDFNGAIQTSSGALTGSQTPTLLPRDKTLLNALSSLVNNDEAQRDISKITSTGNKITVAEWRTWLTINQKYLDAVTDLKPMAESELHPALFNYLNTNLMLIASNWVKAFDTTAVCDGYTALRAADSIEKQDEICLGKRDNTGALVEKRHKDWANDVSLDAFSAVLLALHTQGATCQEIARSNYYQEWVGIVGGSGAAISAKCPNL